MKYNRYFVCLITLTTVVLFFSCSKENLNSAASAATEMNNPDDAVFTGAKMNSHGNIYIESNDAALNKIFFYKQNDGGSLTLQEMVNSGGAGAGIALGSQGAICLSDDHQWLFAVNAGDNSVSSFMVGGDGSLTLMHTISSGGEMPVSVTSHGNYVYVVNFMSADINGFTVGADGHFTAIAGSNMDLSTANAQPGEIKFHPSGDILYVTEKHTNRISTFSVNGAGSVSDPDYRNAAGEEPFGFDFARDQFMIVTNATDDLPHQASVTSYNTTPTGQLKDVNDSVGNNQTASCWAVVTENGRYAYVTNTGSNTISSYYIDAAGALTLKQPSASATGLAPIDVTLLGNYWLYNINSMSHTIGEFTREPDGGLTPIGEVSGLPNFAAGIAGF